MNTFALKLSLFLVVVLSLVSCGENILNIESENYYLKLEDNPEFLSDSIDLSDWFQWNDYIDPTNKGICWIKMKPKAFTKDYKDLAIMLVATGTYEAYWDGQYIGSNADVKKITKDDNGDYVRSYALPDTHINKGEHTLTLRFIKSYTKPNHHSYFTVSDTKTIYQRPLHITKWMFFIGGISFLAAMYFFFLWINQVKNISMLIFSAICFLILSLTLFEYIKLFHEYPYTFQRTRLEIISYLHMSLAFLVPLYFMLQFSFPYKKLAILIIIIPCGYLWFDNWTSYDNTAFALNRLLMIYSFLVLAYSLYAKKKGAMIPMIGIIISFILIYVLPKFDLESISHFDITLFLSFLTIVFSMVYAMVINQREQRLAYEAALVTSERLKNELLKKNIKPHFIMNTLTSLIDWVEESPKEGVKFIHHLAEEFEVLNEIADHTLVPISQEIKLCKKHIEIMRFRKEINYSWVDFGIDENEVIPPAILHTAVENGITHGIPLEDGTLQFELRYTKNTREKVYQLLTKARARKDSGLKKIQDGTGMKYIKSRLQESYPDRWKLDSKAHPQGWIVEIKIKEA